ncbi:MAG: L,D-transpeptidase family protein [Candidatus Adiutrix intracellularis]|jgi:murein L,D-transpeptidase YafK|nr:L,D-transpeptidase family protein [Candidatus Adiutrix intracellularis]
MIKSTLFMFQFLFISLILAGQIAKADPLADEDMLPTAIIYPGETPGYIMVVDKANQMLYLYFHDAAGQITLERIIPCSTGEESGDKMTEGDRKTPNGFYIFNQKLLPRELAPIYGILAYPTDYPNFWDRHLGRGGYGIWLHGINKLLTDYDSNGCIELENADLTKLENLIKLFDTPIIIYETLLLAPVASLQQEAIKVREFVESWRRSWENKDHTAYQEKYSPDFVNSDSRSFAAWMTHKKNVATNYKTIKVEIKNLRIYRHRDIITVVFEQNYRGDKHFTSMGLKQLYLEESDGSYRIVGEDFKSNPVSKTTKWLTAKEKELGLTTPSLTATVIKPEPEGNRAATEARIAAENQTTVETKLTPINISEELPATDSAIPTKEEIRALSAATKVQTETKTNVEAEVRTQTQVKTDRKAQQKELVTLVEQWAAAWAGKDLTNYFQFYHPEFQIPAKSMDLKIFKAHRAKLIQKAKVITVQISGFVIEIKDEVARVEFQQNYRSDLLQDRGRKTLVFKKTKQNWRIISETWKTN